MQVSQSYDQYKKRTFLVLKMLLSVGILTFVLNRLVQEEVAFDLLYNSYSISILAIVCLLMIVNWWLEAEKWKLAIPNENLTLQDSLHIVLVGQAMNWLLPYASGDFVARVTSVQNKLNAAKHAMILRTMSLYLTCLFGLSSILFYFKYLNVKEAIFFLLISVLCPFLILNVLHQLRSLIWLVLFTLVRYCVFTLQLVLLIDMQVDLPASIIFLGVGWIFLFKTFTPGLLGKVGVREMSGILFFQAYITNDALIILPCLLIWLINSVVPSSIGALLLLRGKRVFAI